MKRIVISGAIALVLIASLGLASCTSAVEAKTGTIEVRVTDAPGDVEEIWVTVSEVEVNKAVDDGDEEWIPIDIVAGTFDLLLLEELELVVAVGGVEVGKYTQVRMTISEVEVKFFEVEDLVGAKLPSGKLKFVRPFDVGIALTEGATITLVLDFDAEKSFVVTGAGEVIVKPVVKLEIQQGGKPHQLATVVGTISAVDTEEPDLSVSIIPDVGDTIVLIVNPQTEITLDGEPASLGDLDGLGEGNSVTAYYYLNNLKATQIDAL